MNSYMAFDAVNTKIVTKKSRILNEDKLDKILKCNTVAQITEYLKENYDLKSLIENAKISDIHRHDLETILKRYEVSEIENILHYFSGPYKDFLKVFLMKSEISDLVLILGRIVKGEDMTDIDNRFTHSAQYSKQQYNKLKASGNVAQFIEKLKYTPYYNYIKTIDDNDIVRREFHIDMKMQALFFKTLLDRAEKLGMHDRQLAKEMIGLKIDVLNIQWLYRAKKYYRISPEEMFTYSLQGGEKTSFERLKRLCYTESMEEFRRLSQKYLKVDIFDIENDFVTSRNIDNYMYGLIKDRRFQERGTIGPILSFVFILETAIKNLTTITEGVRYSLPEDFLKQFLTK